MNIKIVKLLLIKTKKLNINTIEIILKKYWDLLPKRKRIYEWIPLDKISWKFL